jgi:hypothetical protein
MKIILFLNLILTSLYTFSQSECSFKIIDTLYVKKGYEVLYSDSLNKSFAIFYLNKRDIKLDFDFQNIDSSQFISIGSGSLNTIFLMCRENKHLTKKYKTEGIASLKLKTSTKKLLKSNSQISIYKIKSTRGFVIWEINKEDYNYFSIIEEKKYNGKLKFLKLCSPLSESVGFKYLE